MFFPEGISVGCMPSAVHFNPVAFGEDAEIFRPERWLEADRETLRLMEAAHLGFSGGSRVCLGQHIAVMQMKKVVTTVLMKFQVSENLFLRLKKSHILPKSPYSLTDVRVKSVTSFTFNCTPRRRYVSSCGNVSDRCMCTLIKVTISSL